MKHTSDRTAFHRVSAACGLSVLMAVAPLAGAQAPAAAPSPPGAAEPVDTSSEHTSYLFGLTFGEQMHSVGITNQLDAASIQRGLQDGLQGKKSTRPEQQQIQEYVHSIMVAVAAKNKEAAQEFLTRNGHEKNVKTTASGLQYTVLTPGNAKAPAILPTDEVSVNYRGKLLDGSEFDSSYSRGTPATFKINGVIKGWQEALVMMKPGAKWQLFIPPDLAYGDSPRPGIPAGSVLIFDVELLEVKPAAAAQGAPPAQALPQSKPHRAVQPPAAAPTP